MKVKTCELTGVALDWAVAKAEAGEELPESWHPYRCGKSEWRNGPYFPSIDWSQGGPIIEREGIASWHSATPENGLWAAADARWMSLDPDSDEFLAMPDPYHGPTPLVAAMRCYVASKLGDTVDIPEELL